MGACPAHVCMPQCAHASPMSCQSYVMEKFTSNFCACLLPRLGRDPVCAPPLSRLGRGNHGFKQLPLRPRMPAGAIRVVAWRGPLEGLEESRGSSATVTAPNDLLLVDGIE
jgi:hypothetical protein